MEKSNDDSSNLLNMLSIKRKPIVRHQYDIDQQHNTTIRSKAAKTLLLHLPFWTPLMPPMGICKIKSYLQQNGYDVRTADFNADGELRRFYQLYFDNLKSNVPDDKKGNFFSIGHEVLTNHMLAYINSDNEKKYFDLVRIIVAETYFIELDEPKILKLNSIVAEYFCALKISVARLIDAQNPDILGISVFRDTLPSALFVFRLIKEKYQEIETVMGGPIFSEQLVIGTPDYDYFMKVSANYIDKIFVGPGELLFCEYLNGNLSPDERVYTEKDLIGKQQVLPATLIADYSDLDLSNYLYLGATGSTGCLYRCSFCNVMKYFGPFNARDVKQTVDEIESLYKTYNIPLFYMTDHLLNPIATQLAEEIKRRHLKIYWTAYLRIDNSTCNFENTSNWKEGGMYCARIGIESGSQDVLSYMGKTISVEQSKLSLISLANSGIKTTAYFVLGHPGETEDDFQKTLDFLDAMKDYIWEAECDYFNYNYSGQSHSDRWSGLRKLVYPEDSRDILVCQKWSLDCYPSRSEILTRVSRFSTRCQELGIPNTYSYHDVYIADERWKRLHDNSVPALLGLRWTTLSS